MKKIETRQAYYQAMAEIESYLTKGFANLTHVEEKELDDLSNAVEAWEDTDYPMPLKPDFKKENPEASPFIHIKDNTSGC